MSSVRNTQQSSDMVERVAQRLAKFANFEPPIKAWNDRPEWDQNYYRNAAKAALEASHHAELERALRESRDILFEVARSLPAQSHAHGVAASGGRRIAALLAKISSGQFECAARRQGAAGGNDPADCDYPNCGCDQ